LNQKVGREGKCRKKRVTYPVQESCVPKVYQEGSQEKRNREGGEKNGKARKEDQTAVKGFEGITGGQGQMQEKKKKKKATRELSKKREKGRGESFEKRKKLPEEDFTKTAWPPKSKETSKNERID